MQIRAPRSGSGRGAFRRGPLPFGAAMRQTVYRQKRNRHGEERGFSLIEVLLAMVFLAIGLLAIAAMQDVAMGANMKAKRMSFATNLVTELIERIRYNAPANSTAPYPYNFTVTCTTTACAGGTAPTTTNSTAQGDYNQWKGRLANLEPSTGCNRPGLSNSSSS